MDLAKRSGLRRHKRDAGGEGIVVDVVGDIPEDIDHDQLLATADMDSPDQDDDLDEDEGERVMGDSGMDDMPFDANLAEAMTKSQRSRLAMNLLDKIDVDLASRKEWYDRFQRGLKAAGVIEQEAIDQPISTSKEIPLGSAVIHPLFFEAAVQFQSRAIAEIFPPQGPAKGMVLGKSNAELEESRDRVESHMNWQCTMQDKQYFWDTDKMLFALPFAGSVFKKHYWDEIMRRVTSRYLPADNVIVPYSANNDEDAPRIAHWFSENVNSIRKRQALGEYVDDIALTVPQQMNARSQVADKADARVQTMHEDDWEYEMYEVCLDLDLEGFEDTDDEGEPTQIALPYRVTVCRDTNDIFQIKRNWEESDELRRKETWYTHYRYLPGLGYYGFGLFHAIGGLGDAATATMRSILDAAEFANFQGGFKAKEARLPGKTVRLIPGVYQDVDMTADELNKAFYTPNFPGPHESMFKVLGLLTEMGQRFASTTESMVGEGNNAMPVGTMLARIEQGSKVYSAIHKRIHVACGEELEIRYKLNSRHLDEEGFAFFYRDQSVTVMRTDYNPRIGVRPVSDPNIYSQTQRLTMAREVLGLANTAPGMYDMREVHRDILESFKHPDIDRILIDPEKSLIRLDALTEYTMVLTNQPIRAFQEQHHESHLAAHMAQVEMLKNTPMAQVAVPMMISHVAEHYAMLALTQVSAQIGIPIPPVFQMEKKDRKELPPEIEQQLSAQVAQITQQMMQQSGPGGGVSQEQLAQMAQQLQLREQEITGNEQRLRDERDKLERERITVEGRTRMADLQDGHRMSMEKVQADAQDQIAQMQESILAKAAELEGKERQLTDREHEAKRQSLVGDIRSILRDHSSQIKIAAQAAQAKIGGKPGSKSAPSRTPAGGTDQATEGGDMPSTAPIGTDIGMEEEMPGVPSLATEDLTDKLDQLAASLAAVNSSPDNALVASVTQSVQRMQRTMGEMAARQADAVREMADQQEMMGKTLTAALDKLESVMEVLTRPVVRKLDNVEIGKDGRIKSAEVIEIRRSSDGA